MGEIGFLFVALVVVSAALYVVRRNSEKRARILKSESSTTSETFGEKANAGFGIVEVGDAYDFITFRKMFTPLFIQSIFWVAAATCVARGLSLVWRSSEGHGSGVNEQAVIGGLALALLGPIVVRILCECLIVVFRMNDTLTEAKNGIERIQVNTTRVNDQD